MLRAGIDVGTNTILLLIAEVEEGRVVRVFEDRVRVVRLGQGVDKDRAFRPEAMARAMDCFREYGAVLGQYERAEVRAVATSGSRDARNSAEFFARVSRETGIEVRIISGEEEAQLSLLGALPEGAKDPRAFAVLDIGGGSTEIVGAQSLEIGSLFRYSFDMGCVRLSERFLASDPPRAQELEALLAFVRGELEGQCAILSAVKGRELVGVAGTATYIAAAALGLTAFDVEKVHGAPVTLAQVRELRARFAKQTAAERLGVGGMDQGRADVIVAGAMILEEMLAAAGLRGYTASVRGLRYGVVLTEVAPKSDVL